MPVNTAFDLPPVRPGAAPTIDLVATNLDENAQWQPAWVRVTAGLVKWLRFHFASAARIEHPALADRVWTADPSSPIFISSLAEWNPTQSTQRPAVLVDRLEQAKDMGARAIGDQFQGGAPGRYGHLMQGRHVVHCLGGREGEADLLAWEVWRELVRFARPVGQRLCLLRLLPERIGKRVQLTAESKEHYTTPIELGYGYLEEWRLTVQDEPEVTAINTLLADL
jgi:hypothetical protein